MTDLLSLQLIRMMDAFPGEGRGEIARNRILQMASGPAESREGPNDQSRPLFLHIPVPSGMVVWALRPAKAIATNFEQQTTGELLAEIYERMSGSLFAAPAVPQVDVDFLTLAREDAADLATKACARVHWFSRGLRQHNPFQRVSPLQTRILETTFEQVSLGSSLCVRPIAFERHFTSALDDFKLPYDAEFEIDVGLEDLYVDKLVALRLCQHYDLPLPNQSQSVPQSEGNPDVASHGRLPDPDPYRLKNHANGVYALYRVARDYYEKGFSKDNWPRPRTVADVFNERMPKLFNASERALQAAKFINPLHRREKGPSSEKALPFTSKAKHIIKTEYGRRETFVTESLALIIHATGKWLEWLKHPPTGNKTTELQRELQSYGFGYEEEMKAIFAFIMWDR